MVCRHALRKVFARVMLTLFSRVELGDRTVIAHDARPDFTARALGLSFRVDLVHIVSI